MAKTNAQIPVTAFLVLSLLAEASAHGYELEHLVWNRGFRFWTDIKRSSIYNALKMLEERGFVKAKTEEGGGPVRRVFGITDLGRKIFENEALRHLAYPSHPHSEIDLGIYSLSLLNSSSILSSLTSCLDHLKGREKFLQERLQWCWDNDLEIPALAFERPLYALQAEIKFLERLKSQMKKGRMPKGDWKKYIYKEPPSEGFENGDE